MAARPAGAGLLGKRLPPSMTVLVCRPGDENNCIQMPRQDMIPATLNEKFAGTVEYLTERRTGTVLWPARWIYDCLPPPARYLVHIEVTEEKASDILEDWEYRGETLVLIRNVPDPVTMSALQTWFKAGLEDEQPELVYARSSVSDLERKLRSINYQIAALPNTAGDRAENTEEELETRRRRAEFLKRLKVVTEEQLNAVREKLAELQKRSNELRVTTMSKVEGKPPFYDATWEVRFTDSDEAEELAYIACHKRNWAEYWLMLDSRGNESRAGRGERPPETGLDEVVMERVVVERARHGQGMFKHGGDAGFYSGQWRHGLYHGIGTQINALGRFQGHHVLGTRHGKGTQVGTRGEVYRGDWGFDLHHPKASYIDGEEYLEGRPHGRGEVEFVDGAVYRGEVRNGMPCGRGRYTMPTGDMIEGEFTPWGVLTGEGSTSIDGVTLLGSWRHGLLNGFGTEIDGTVGTYDGDFEASLKHGYGSVRYRLVDGGFVGGFVCGERGGYGLLDFTPVEAEDATRGDRKLPPGAARAAAGAVSPRGAGAAGPRGGKAGAGASRSGAPLSPSAVASSTSKAKAKLLASLPDSGEYRCEGRWRANTLKAGGVRTQRNGEQGNPLAYSFEIAPEGRNDKMPFLQTLTAQELAVTRDRQARARTLTRSLRDQRRAKERSNAVKFAYWMRVADRKMGEIAAETKAARGYLKQIAGGLDERRRRAAAEEAERNKPPEDPFAMGSRDPDEDEGDGAAAAPGSPGAAAAWRPSDAAAAAGAGAPTASGGSAPASAASRSASRPAPRGPASTGAGAGSASAGAPVAASGGSGSSSSAGASRTAARNGTRTGTGTTGGTGTSMGTED